MESDKPSIRKRPEHCISRRDICPNALKVLYRLARKGHTAYLVGGGVRDLLLGRKPKDFDVSTSAHPNEIKRLFRNCFLIGRRFRLAHIKYDDHVIETSTFRRRPETQSDPADPEADLLQNDDNEFGTPEEDAARRDFTINGLFYDIESFSVIDYVGGLDDLDAKLVRSIGDPDIRFREDPVRMLRAVRFASRLGFAIEERTREAIARQVAEINKASPPRMLEEIYRLFAFGAAEAAFRLLRETGLMRHILPELEAHIDASGGENSPVWALLRQLDGDAAPLAEPTQALMLAALLYDHIRSCKEEENQPARENSLERSKEAIRIFSSRYPLPRRIADGITRIVVAQDKLRPGRRKRFSKSNFVRQEYFPEALALYGIARRADHCDPASFNDWLELYRKNGNGSRPQPERAPRSQPQPTGDADTESNELQANQDTEPAPVQPQAQTQTQPGTGGSRSGGKRRRRPSRRRGRNKRRENPAQSAAPAESRSGNVSAADNISSSPAPEQNEPAPAQAAQPAAKPETTEPVPQPRQAEPQHKVESAPAPAAPESAEKTKAESKSEANPSAAATPKPAPAPGKPSATDKSAYESVAPNWMDEI